MSNVTLLARTRGASAQSAEESGRPWKIFLAGKMRIVRPDGEDAPPAPKKARALIAFLCLATHMRSSRTALASLLWDKTDERARRNLRHALFDIDQIDGLDHAVTADQESAGGPVLVEVEQHGGQRAQLEIPGVRPILQANPTLQLSTGATSTTTGFLSAVVSSTR